MAEGARITGTVDFRADKTATILKLAIPTVFAMLMQSSVNVVDDVYFRHLPDQLVASNAQSALQPSLILVWLFGGSLGAISVGTQAITARRFAEGKYHAAGAVLSNAVWFTLVGGAVTCFAAYFLIPFILARLIPNPDVRAIAESYSHWRLFAFISMSMTQAVKGFFDGIGRTTYHFVASLVMNVANVALCWVFIFGHLGFRAMGPEGAGFSAFISTWIGLGVMLVYVYFHRDDFQPVQWGNVSRSLTWDMVKLSFPAAIATIVMMFGFALFTKIVNVLDAGAVEAVNGAATTNIIQIMMLTFTACIAFGTSTATLVSQSLGRKEPEEAAKYGWASVRLGLVVFGAVGLCEGLIFREQVIHIFAATDGVRVAMHEPMMLVGVVTPLISIALILSEALFGAGSTKFVAVAQFLLVFGVLVPGAWIVGLRLHVGLNGIWISACCYAVLAASVMAVKFRSGDWKQIRL
jgi:multidrug resistance protein, MATE family